MNDYDEFLRTERKRAFGFSGNIYENDEDFECPICGSCDWDFLFKDCHGDVIGCQECVTKIYPDEKCMAE